jgi:ABC-2 type transport system permease protein
MSLRRVGILFLKEFRGPKNFVFVMAVVMPVTLTFAVSVLFGTLFSEKARLGIVDLGDSQIPVRAVAVRSMITREYRDSQTLQQDVARGAIDIGVVLPAGFDDRVAASEPTEMKIYIWSESQLKHQATLGASLITFIRGIANREPQVEIVTTVLGAARSLPWEDRLLPFIILMSMLIGGLMIPATSMVEERQAGTLKALTTTPITLGEVMAAKGLMGLLISSTMGILTLAMNRALGAEAPLLISTLVLGACMAVVIGLLLGVVVKDINTLFAAIKSLGIVLYAPALIYLIPEIPAWLGRLFPTYYAINPVIEIIQHGAGLPDLLGDLIILVGLIGVLIVLLGWAGRRSMERAT